MAACEQSIKAAERQLSELELSVPKARMEAEAEAAKAQDIQQRLDELKAATKVGGMVNRLVSQHQPFETFPWMLRFLASFALPSPHPLA